MRIFLICLLLSLNCAANWVKDSELISGDIKTVYLKKKKCGSDCVKIPIRYNKNFHKRMEVMIDDLSKPNYEAESQVESCSSESDCLEKLAAKDCGDSELAPYKKYVSAENDKVYCTRIVSYQKKGTGSYEVRVDESLKSAYEALKAAKIAESNAVDSQLLYMEHGKRIYASIQLLSKSKGLNKAQRRKFRRDNKEIKDDLLEGNLCNARSDIQAMAVDGVLITNQAEIDSILQKIDSITSCP